MSVCVHVWEWLVVCNMCESVCVCMCESVCVNVQCLMSVCASMWESVWERVYDDDEECVCVKWEIYPRNPRSVLLLNVTL